MNNLSSQLSKVLATAVVTATALSGQAFAAGCAGAKCGPKTTAMAASGACSGKCGAVKAKAHKAKAKCGAAKSKCGACAGKK